MSKNRRKKSHTPITVEEPPASRVVAIPKDPEIPTALKSPEHQLSQGLAAFEEGEPERELPRSTASAPSQIEADYVPEIEPPLPPPPVAEPSPPPRAEPRPAPRAKQKSKSERIGDVLRAARLERGDDLYLIAEYLCIKPSFLIALESSRYEELPADAYVIGFLRTYANFLGFDGKEAVDRYRYEMAGRRKKPVLAMPTPVSEGRAPSGIIMVGATLALLVIYGLWYSFSSSNRADRTPPPIPTAVQTAPGLADTSAAGLTAPVAVPTATPVPVPPPPPAADPAAPLQSISAPAAPAPAPSPTPTAPSAPAPAPAAPPSETPQPQPPAPLKEEKQGQVFGDERPSRVVIRATQNSWIMVVDPTGKAVFDRVLKPGESYKVPDAPGLTLTTGNGNGIVVSVDGADLPKIAAGAPRVMRNISLDPDRLAAKFADR